MNSSIGTLSGTEPSSPNVSEDYSRGYSSSDMSGSLISADGSNILQKVDKISRFFPKLDDDLNSVCAQLSVDTLELEDVFVQETESGTCLTPISLCSEINSAAATKGSTTMTESTNDDDDESTISVDTLSTTAGDLNEIKTSHDSLPPVLTVSEEKPIPRIRKQISLFEGALSGYGSSSTSSYGYNSGDPKSPVLINKKLNERREKFENAVLVQSTSNDNFVFKKDGDITPSRSPKTKSCMNLKSCNHPGALVVKEIFIEPPKRIARSFHGKTEHGRTSIGSKSLDEASIPSNITQKCGGSVQKLRFITTKVDENTDNK